MFNKTPDEKISAWVQFRNSIESSETPLADVIDYWKAAPYIPYNNKIDPFNYKSWPTPWEIVIENKYDDFTKAVMIGWTLKLTRRYSNSKIEVRTLVDNQPPAVYNICCVDDEWVLNYSDEGPVLLTKLPDRFLVENLIELGTLR